MREKGGIKGALPRLNAGFDVSIVDIVRGEHCEPAVVVIVVVPIEQIG